jgi:hypothetical protein
MEKKILDFKNYLNKYIFHIYFTSKHNVTNVHLINE